MYIADLFNANNLFQTFGGWFRDTKATFFTNFMEITNKDYNNAWNKWLDSVQIFEILLGYATSIILNLNQIKYLEQRCISQFKGLEPKLHIIGNRIIFWSHKLVNLLGKISPIINTLRIMEELLLELIKKKIRHPLPIDLSIIIKEGPESYPDLPLPIWKRFEQYWNKVGFYIRKCRNIDQYLFSLTTHSYIDISTEVKLMVVLPDNPDMETGQKFTYEKQIDAVRLLDSAFKEFHSLTEDISAFFKYQPTYILQVWSFLDYQYLPAKEGTVALVIKNPEKNKGVEVIKEGARPIFNKISLDMTDDADDD